MSDCIRSSLKKTYETARTIVKQDTLQKQKVAVESCLQVIESALAKGNNTYSVLKVDLLKVNNVNRDVLNEVSKELNQLEIDHSFQYYAGCQREDPEAFFLIKF